MSEDLDVEQCIRCNRRVSVTAPDFNDGEVVTVDVPREWQMFDRHGDPMPDVTGYVCGNCLTDEERDAQGDDRT